MDHVAILHRGRFARERTDVRPVEIDVEVRPQPPVLIAEPLRERRTLDHQGIERGADRRSRHHERACTAREVAVRAVRLDEHSHPLQRNDLRRCRPRRNTMRTKVSVLRAMLPLVVPHDIRGTHRAVGRRVQLLQRDRPLRVLAVEDDPELLEFYGTILREEGHDVRLARHGADGLGYVEWQPDLILLDLMMPVMDGYDFLRRLRATPQGAHIPVLVLSAAMPPGRATVRGAQAVLRKPFDFDRLLRTIEMYGRRPAPGAN